jgi:uncharacterized membrane protein YdjX (TVP38/TMEM64 family)
MFNHRIKIAFAMLWASVFAFALYSWFKSGIALGDVPAYMSERLGEFGLFKAATIYIVLYALRPLILFPATLLTVASGLIFGPWLGIAFTVIGENASANFAFFLARWMGRDWISAHERGGIVKWEGRLKDNGLVTVLIMRLIYLPFDAVNFGCGLTSIKHRDFFIGTFIGIIPALISFVLFGGVASAAVENRYLVLAIAIFFFVLGLIIARVLHKMRPEEGKGE